MSDKESNHPGSEKLLEVLSSLEGSESVGDKRLKRLLKEIQEFYKKYPDVFIVIEDITLSRQPWPSSLVSLTSMHVAFYRLNENGGELDEIGRGGIYRFREYKLLDSKLPEDDYTTKWEMKEIIRKMANFVSVSYTGDVKKTL